MNRKFIYFAIAGISLFFTPFKANAVGCGSFTPYTSESQALSAETACKGQNKVPARFNLTDSGSAQCKADNRQPNGSYIVCCDDAISSNAYDSVKQPLCGSSAELGNGNSVCWSCDGGGNVYCSGADFRLGGSSPALEQLLSGAPNSNGLWRPTDAQKQALGSSFVYNGVQYQMPGGDLAFCGSNVKACLVTKPGNDQFFNTCTNRALEPGSTPNANFPRITPPVQTKGNQGTASPPSGGGAVETILANPGIIAGDPIVSSFPLSGSLTTFFAKIIAATISYTDDIHTSMSNFQNIGTMMEGAASQPLMPAALQAEFSPVDAEGKPVLRSGSLYRLCLPAGSKIDQPTDKPPTDNVPLRGATLTTGTVGANAPINPRAWPQTVGGSRLLAAVLGPPTAAAKGVNLTTVPGAGDPVPIQEVNQNGKTFYDTPDMNAVDQVTPQCDDIANGIQYDFVKTQAAGQATTNGSQGGLIGFFESLVSKITSTLNLSGLITSCPAGECADVPYKIVKGHYVAANIAATSQTLGLKPSQIDRMNPADRATIILAGGGDPTQQNAPGGWIRSQLPHDVTEKIDYANTTEKQGQTLLSNVLGNLLGTNANDHPLWLKGIIDGVHCTTENMLLPAQYQKDNSIEVCPYITQEEPYPGTSDRPIIAWTAAQSIPANFQSTFFQGNVKDAIANAAKDKIPQCVLEGVKFIESGPDWTGGGQCHINQCAAAGPFQITVGVDGSGDPTCKSCGGPNSSWSSGQRKCPDSWPGNWPTDTSAPSPCDVQLSANQAVQILIDKAKYWTNYILGQEQALSATDSVQNQKNAIILAGNSYYGSATSIGRLGNCSYGEFVYKHCDPSYQCGTGNIQLSK